MDTAEPVDRQYYQVATPNSLAERMVVIARDGIYRDFIRLTRPTPDTTILDVGVSDVLSEAANVLARKYPHQRNLSAVGLGSADAFQAAFPDVAYRQIVAGEALPFADKSFDVAASNAVLEHLGSEAAQSAFLSEMMRVARCAFVTVPHKYFPVEHHTGVPFLHWSEASFRLACGMLGKRMWTDPANLILMTRARLRLLSHGRIGTTGIRLGPFSSNLYLMIGPELRRDL